MIWKQTFPPWRLALTMWVRACPLWVPLQITAFILRFQSFYCRVQCFWDVWKFSRCLFCSHPLFGLENVLNLKNKSIRVHKKLGCFVFEVTILFFFGGGFVKNNVGHNNINLCNGGVCHCLNFVLNICLHLFGNLFNL